MWCGSASLAQEGSDEAALALLGPKKVIVITRMDGGDWTDTLPSHLRPPHMKPYRMATSTDAGFTFSRGRPMTDDQGRAIGCARPKLLPLVPDANTQPSDRTPLLLVGGRPGLFLWLSADGAQSWQQYNIAAKHNAHSPLKYCAAFVSATLANASEYFSPAPSGAYSSLVQVDASSALVCYNREPVLREWTANIKPSVPLSDDGGACCLRALFHQECPASVRRSCEVWPAVDAALYAGHVLRSAPSKCLQNKLTGVHCVAGDVGVQNTNTRTRSCDRSSMALKNPGRRQVRRRWWPRWAGGGRP